MHNQDFSISRKITPLVPIVVVIFSYFCDASRDPLRAARRDWPHPSRTLCAFGDPKYFTNQYIHSNKPDVMIKVPNFDVLFDDICKVSPLARQALNDEHPGGISDIDKNADVYQWRVTDSFNPKRLIKEIDKIDGFEKRIPPLIRLRTTLHGPKKKRGEMLSDVFATEVLRHQWDPTNDVVEQIYYGDLDELKAYQDERYGTCSMFGIGYVKTIQSVVSPREQLTLCGVQNFKSGASIIWAVELEESQNHLFPENQPKRVPRSTTHLFSTTVIPLDDETFDVEYVLQLEIGGFPGWLTGPVVIETLKKMFRFADEYFRGGLTDGALAKKLALIPDGDGDFESTKEPKDVLEKKQALLMPP